MLTVKCPRCLHDMLYGPKGAYVVGKKKRCVYCGLTFSVHSNQEATRIVCVGPRAVPNSPLC